MPHVTLENATLHYTEKGTGRPLLLVHGFPLDSRVWQHQIDHLSGQYRVIAPDLRGFGQSLNTAAFTLDDLADDLHQLLVHLKATPAVVVGLSMGGYVAFSLAKRHTADLAGLVLADTKADADTTQGKQARNDMIALVQREGSEAIADKMMPNMLSADTVQRRPEVQSSLREIMNACPPTTIAHALAAMRDREDHNDYIPSIPVPLLLIYGQNDAITPPTHADAIQQKCPRATKKVIANAGHMTPIEAPEEVTAALQAFLPQCFG
jgi:3-oxoadipate enol-lactonase